MSPPRRRAFALAILLCASCEAAVLSDETALSEYPADTTPTFFKFPPDASRAMYELFLDNQQTLPVIIHGSPLRYPAEVACHAEAIRPNRGRKDVLEPDERNQIVCEASSGRGLARVALSLHEAGLTLSYGNNLTMRTFSIATRIDTDIYGNIHSSPEEVLAFQNHVGRRLLYAMYNASKKERTPDTIYSIEWMNFGTPGISAIADYTLIAEILPRPEARKDPNGPPVAGERAVITCLLSGVFAKGRQVDRSLFCAFIDEIDR